MRWTLTDNYLDGGRVTAGNSTIEHMSLPSEFRLLDDDGEIYFQGLLDYGDLADADGDEAFEPLDTFGSAYGCTELQYKAGGCWHTL